VAANARLSRGDDGVLVLQAQTSAAPASSASLPFLPMLGLFVEEHQLNPMATFTLKFLVDTLVRGHGCGD